LGRVVPVSKAEGGQAANKGAESDGATCAGPTGSCGMSKDVKKFHFLLQNGFAEAFQTQAWNRS